MKWKMKNSKEKYQKKSKKTNKFLGRESVCFLTHKAFEAK